MTLGFSLLGFLFLIAFFKLRAPVERFEYFLTTIIIGVSFCALVPIGLGALEIPPTKINLQIFFLFFFIILAFLISRKISKKSLQLPSFEAQGLSSFWILVVFYLFVIVVRIVQVKDIFVPNWIDGLIHTQLLNKLSVSEKIGFGRIYHVGFHAVSLVIYYFMRLNLSDVVLLFGQWLSATCGVTIYILVRRYTRNLFFSLISLVFYSLLLLFPSFLVSWGRYPFLFGLTVLPLVMVMSWKSINNKSRSFSLSFFLVLALAMIHYGALLIWFSFIFINLLYWLIITLKQRKDLKSWLALVLRFFLLLIPLFLFVLPKAVNLLTHKDILEKINSRAENVNITFDFFSALNLVFRHDYFLILLFLLGVVVSFVWKKRMFWMFVLWPFLVFGMTWFQYSFLGFSLSTYYNLVIFLSIPYTVLVSLIVKHLCFLDQPLVVVDKYSGLKQLAALLALLFFGFRINTSVIDPGAVIFVAQDYSAINWIKENTPVNSVFFVESFLWGDKLMPSDGGGWVELLTSRKVVFPRKIGELYDMCVFIKDNNIDYLYLHDNSSEDEFELRLSDLNTSYKVVYADYIIKIVTVNCP